MYKKIAVQAILTAGEELKKGFRSSFKMKYKSNEHDIVTEYDIRAEEIIVSFIKKHFKEHQILSEEMGKESSDSEFLWIIDPLDGTSNFTHGIPVFGISIALQKNRQTILGVIYQPITDELFIAEKGKGAYLNNHSIKVSETFPFKKAFLSTGFPYNLSENPNHTIEAFVKIAQIGVSIRRLGAAAIDLAYLADGRYDIFWETGLGPWDCAAGQLLIEEAGGKVTDWKGNPLQIADRVTILASNNRLHQEMINLLS